jgi:biotin operon repressor
MTAFQEKLTQILRTKNFNGSLSTTDLASLAKTSRPAVWTAMRSLEQQGLAGSFRHGQDRWSPAIWYLKQKELTKQ